MSAPKPRVTRRGLTPAVNAPALVSTWMSGGPIKMRPWYGWECPCGAFYRGPIRFGWESAIASATRHSRTHTAERIADLLERLARVRQDDSFTAIEAAGRETDYSIYQHGIAKGLNNAERIVRQYLVKETP